MINNKRILALITAREGSKGIPGKNIKPLGGLPLICWTINAAKESKYIDKLVLSSDGLEIIRIAHQYGCDAPFIRPKELAKDETSSMEVIEHALASLPEKFDYLLLLQPTSPFRTPNDIDLFIESSISKRISVSVCKLKKHPMYMYYIENEKLVPFFENGSLQLRRQDMPPAYEHNGALYLAEIETLSREKSFNTPHTAPYITTGDINIDIDTPDDWNYAELVAKRWSVKFE